MWFKKNLTIFILFFTIQNIFSVSNKNDSINDEVNFSNSKQLNNLNTNLNINNNRPNPLWYLFRLKKAKNKRITAIVLAFPFPFGIVGLHRIYLGCAPYIPVVYITSIGGLGLLPFIDFCVLISEKDFEKYNNSKEVFMWRD